MLTGGKRPPSQVTAFRPSTSRPSTSGDAARRDAERPVERLVGPPPRGGLLFRDNSEVLAHLLANGFRGMSNSSTLTHPSTAADYVRRVRSRAPAAPPRSRARATPSASRSSTRTSGPTITTAVYGERLLLLESVGGGRKPLYLHFPDSMRKDHPSLPR